IAQGQGVAALGEFNVAQGAHAQQHGVTIHGRIDAGAHAGKRDVGDLQLVDDGRVHHQFAVGGGGAGRVAALHANRLGKLLGHDHVGGTGVEQEDRRLTVNVAVDYI